jgi:hypothetical protein
MISKKINPARSFISLLIIFFICSCDKRDIPFFGITSNSPDSLILVDASRDGGVWWYPQAGVYSESRPHQGLLLADYLRKLGYTVNELPRGAVITWAELKKYKKIIRANSFGNYTASEIAAYDSFLTRPSSLLLLSDHKQNTTNDNLSAHLGLNFSGSYNGTITPVSAHAINAGVTGLPFIAGSVILQPDPVKMLILGNVVSTSGSPGYAAMGIMFYPGAKIFFIGDTNGIESVPQPFISNLVKWLF